MNGESKPLDAEIVNSSKMVILIGVKDGCHQVILNAAQRNAIVQLLIRMHDGQVKVNEAPLPIKIF
jgi:hypothetical protein